MIKAIIKKLIGPRNEHNDVKDFYDKFGQPTLSRPSIWVKSRMRERAAFMQEELDEFKLALTYDQLEGMADALIDLVYVARGTAIELGLPWNELWDDVQRANMAKVVGPTHRGFKMDVKKPPGWIGPKTEEILANAGYEHNTKNGI